jgi:hypothetical protein
MTMLRSFTISIESLVVHPLLSVLHGPGGPELDGRRDSQEHGRCKEEQDQGSTAGKPKCALPRRFP